MRPTSFALAESTAWSLSVLADGLPTFEGHDLGIDESVPVAYWIGPTTAAVLHIRRLIDEDGGLTETDVELFRLTEDHWESVGGGGGGWTDQAPLARLDVAPSYVSLGGMNSAATAGRGCKALWGVVGTAAATAEVTQAGRITRRAVDASTGAFVVCATYEQPFTVRVLDSRGDTLAEIAEAAGDGYGEENG